MEKILLECCSLTLLQKFWVLWSIFLVKLNEENVMFWGILCIFICKHWPPTAVFIGLPWYRSDHCSQNSSVNIDKKYICIVIFNSVEWSLQENIFDQICDKEICSVCIVKAKRKVQVSQNVQSNFWKSLANFPEIAVALMH